MSAYKIARTSDVNQARAGAEKIKTQIGVHRNHRLRGVDANARALDQLATDFDTQDGKLTDELYRELNAVLN